LTGCQSSECLQAAEEEVAALQAPGLVDVSVPVGGQGSSVSRQPYYRLLEQISLHYPTAVPMGQVWGYGRSSWDLAARQYGQKPFRCCLWGSLDDHDCDAVLGMHAGEAACFSAENDTKVTLCHGPSGQAELMQCRVLFN